MIQVKYHYPESKVAHHIMSGLEISVFIPYFIRYLWVEPGTNKRISVLQVSVLIPDFTPRQWDEIWDEHGRFQPLHIAQDEQKKSVFFSK